MGLNAVLVSGKDIGACRGSRTTDFGHVWHFGFVPNSLGEAFFPDWRHDGHDLLFDGNASIWTAVDPGNVESRHQLQAEWSAVGAPSAGPG